MSRLETILSGYPSLALVKYPSMLTSDISICLIVIEIRQRSLTDAGIMVAKYNIFLADWTHN